MLGDGKCCGGNVVGKGAWDGQAGGPGTWLERRHCNLNKAAREDLRVKVTFVQRPDGGEGVRCVALEGQALVGTVQHVQRS